MPEMKSIVLIAGGSVGAAFLDHLLAARNSGLCQISGFLPAGKSQQENLQLRRRAEAAQVTVFAALEDILQGPETWLGFSAGNSILLNEAVLQSPKNGFINFHAAPLPRFRGSAAPAFAIAEGVEEFGITFHKMVLELDAGPIVLSKSFLIEDDSTAKEIDALIQAYRNRQDSSKIFIPTFEGQEGRPVLFENSLRQEILALEPDEPVNGIIEKFRNLLVHVPVDNPYILKDMDTPEDYQECLEIYLREIPNSKH
jgi:hypothetical protein